MSYREYCRAKEVQQICAAIDRITRESPERTDVLEYLSARLGVLLTQCGLPVKNDTKRSA